MARYRDVVPALLDRTHVSAHHVGLAEEVRREIQRERLYVIDRMVPRSGVHGVLHRVGRQARTVVTVDVDRVELAFHVNVDREIDDLVWIAGAPDLDEPNPRLAVPVRGKHATRPDMSCSRTD